MSTNPQKQFSRYFRPLSYYLLIYLLFPPNKMFSFNNNNSNNINNNNSINFNNNDNNNNN